MQTDSHRTKWCTLALEGTSELAYFLGRSMRKYVLCESICVITTEKQHPFDALNAWMKSSYLHGNKIFPRFQLITYMRIQISLGYRQPQTERFFARNQIHAKFEQNECRYERIRLPIRPFPRHTSSPTSWWTSCDASGNTEKRTSSLFPVLKRSFSEFFLRKGLFIHKKCSQLTVDCTKPRKYFTTASFRSLIVNKITSEMN